MLSASVIACIERRGGLAGFPLGAPLVFERAALFSEGVFSGVAVRVERPRLSAPPPCGNGGRFAGDFSGALGGAPGGAPGRDLVGDFLPPPDGALDLADRLPVAI